MQTTALTPATAWIQAPVTVTEQKGMKANYRWVSVTSKPFSSGRDAKAVGAPATQEFPRKFTRKKVRF